MIHDDEEVRGWVRDLLLPLCEVWVAAENGELAGMIALDGERVEQLYVSPDRQRRGHGSRLLEVAMTTRRAQRSGPSRVTMEHEASTRRQT